MNLNREITQRKNIVSAIVAMLVLFLAILFLLRRRGV